MAFAETQHLAVQIDLKGNLNAGLNKVERQLKGLDRATARSQRAAHNFGRNVAIGAGLAVTGIAAVVKSASDYESAFAGVRKTVTATDAQLEELSSQFRQLSKEIPISAAELARLGEAGGALGIATDDLKEFVRVSALLGVTTDLSSDQAAESLGILGNVLHLTGDDFDNFASSLVALGNAGASTESQIIEIAQRAGAAGELIGLSTSQVLGFSSAVASLGIEVEAGGSSLQKFFIESTKAVASGGKELKTFAKVAGVSAKAFKKAFNKDAGKALEDFLAGLGKLSQGEQLAALEDLGFNDIRITRTLLGLANNTKLVGDQMKIANDAFADNTALTKESEQRFNTFSSQLQITKNVLTDMAITIGSKLLPKITPLLKRLNEFVNTNGAGIEKFGDELASSFEKVASYVQEVDFRPFIEALKISAAIAKQAVDIFLSLPKGVQTALIAGLAVNKLAGGLPGAIIKDVAGGIFGALKVMTVQAAVVNVNGGIGGGGGLPGLPAAAGGAAGAAGGVGTAATLGAAGLVIAPIVAGAVLGEMQRQAQVNLGAAGGSVHREMVIAKQIRDSGGQTVAAVNRVGTQFQAGKNKDDQVLGAQMKALAEIERRAKDQGKEPTQKAILATYIRNQARQDAAAAQARQKQQETTQRVKDADSSIDAGALRTANASREAGRSSAATISGAIRANRPIMTQTVTVNVTAGSVTAAVNKQNSYGPANGSSGGGGGSSGPRQT